MNAEKRVLSPSISTNFSHSGMPAVPCIAKSSVLIARVRESFFSLSMRHINSVPSPSRNAALTFGSERAEQRASKMFSMNSVSSALVGSRRR